MAEAIISGNRYFEGLVERCSVANLAYPRALSLPGISAILLPVLFYSHETQFPGFAALPPCIGATLLIATGTDGRSFVSKLLSTEIMTFIGKLSYSLYLWHWPVISLVYYRTGELTASIGFACLVSSLALAYLSWRFVEQPIRDRHRVKFDVIALGSMGVMVCSTGLGVLIWKLDGLPNRVDPRIIAYTQPINHSVAPRRHCFASALEALVQFGRT